MPLNPDAVGTQSEPFEASWTSKDALLYAVGIGAGTEELAFTTENTGGVPQQVFPTFPVVIGITGGSRREGVFSKIGTYNPAMLVHGQQAVTLHRPIPVEGTVSIVNRIAAMYDKEKAAVVVTEAEATPRRRTAVHHHVVGVHQGRGRLGRRPGPVRAAQRAPGTRARPRGHLRDVAGPGPRLPALRGPQPAALRPVVRRDGRLRSPDPARAVHATGSPGGPCCTRCAAPTRRASTTSRAGSPRPSTPARPSPSGPG